MKPFPGALIRIGKSATTTVPALSAITREIKTAAVRKPKLLQIFEQAPCPVRTYDGYVNRRSGCKVSPEVYWPPLMRELTGSESPNTSAYSKTGIDSPLNLICKSNRGSVLARCIKIAADDTTVNASESPLISSSPISPIRHPRRTSFCEHPVSPVSIESGSALARITVNTINLFGLARIIG